MVEDLDHGDVLLRRRDAPDLRLSLEARDEQRSAAFTLVGRTLRNLATHSPSALAAAIQDEFPWTAFLPRADLDEFLAEFTRTVVGAGELDSFAALGQLLHEWQATAAVHADDAFAGRLSGALTLDGDAVPQPG